MQGYAWDTESSITPLTSCSTIPIPLYPMRPSGRTRIPISCCTASQSTLSRRSCLRFSFGIRAATTFHPNPCKPATGPAGQGAAPYLFIGKPRIFPPGSQLGISIQNFSAATNTIQLLFRGEKRFVKPQPICEPDALTNRLLVRR